MSHRYCGRDFSAEDLHLIVDLIAQLPGLSRTALSQRVCQQLGWLKSDGGLKEMSCRVAMLRMQSPLYDSTVFLTSRLSELRALFLVS